MGAPGALAEAGLLRVKGGADMDANTLSSAVFLDPASRSLMLVAEQLAQQERVVLLKGEPGSGKRFLARWMHAHSPRAGLPFVAIDCAAVDVDSQVAGLVGHVPGAIRGGFAESPGWLESAQGGTLFLNEWQALAPQAQETLHRIWCDQSVVRLGSSRRMPVNLRLVLASSARLETGLPQGVDPAWLKWTEGATLRVPALRERRLDILPLARHFLAEQSRRLRRPLATLSADAEQSLLRHPWPGHLRELEAVLQRAVVRAQAGLIGPDELGLPGSPAEGSNSSNPSAEDVIIQDLDSLLWRLGDVQPGRLNELVERALYQHAHQRCAGHQIRAAQLLGVSRNVLRGRLIALGLIDARK